MATYNRLDDNGLLFLLQLLWKDISDRALSSGLSTVATSGSYNDLTDKPNIPEVVNTISNESESTKAASALAVYNFVTDAIKNVSNFHAEIVSVLPETGLTNVMYLVPKATSGDANVYDEYLYINNTWELIGTTAVDLTGYIRDTDMHALTNSEITEIYNNAKAE